MQEQFLRTEMLLGTQARIQGLNRLKEVMRFTSSRSIWAVIS